MQIASVVILFFPDEIEVVKNIHSYLPFVDHLYIIDNTPGEVVAGRPFPKELKSLGKYVRNDKNIGVAAALNKALALAAKQGCEWLLTMDQDSYFEEDQAQRYFERFREITNDKSDVAIVSPSHSAAHSANHNSASIEVISTITSGSLVNIRISQKLGGFEEKLFIDEVDHEYCYRAVVAGFKIIQFPDIYLNHQLGTKKEAGYFSILKKSPRSLHSPFRVYYMVRNYLYVSSKYRKLLPNEFRQRRRGLLTTLKNNLFFSGHFFGVFAAAIKGYLHFKMNKFSK